MVGDFRCLLFGPGCGVWGCGWFAFWFAVSLALLGCLPDDLCLFMVCVLWLVCSCRVAISGLSCGGLAGLFVWCDFDATLLLCCLGVDLCGWCCVCVGGLSGLLVVGFCGLLDCCCCSLSLGCWWFW